MFRCACGHREEDHAEDGSCRVPECRCERFTPIPEMPQRWGTDASAWGGIARSEQRVIHVLQRRQGIVFGSSGIIVAREL